MRQWVVCVTLAVACGHQSTEDEPVRSGRSNHAGEIDAAMDELATQIIDSLGVNKKSKLAVNEFLTLKGDSTDLGKFVSEELATRMIKSGKAQVVERRLLQKVLSEQEIGASQLVDDETAARVGKLLGADTLCVGTLTDLGREIKINARLINAETAEVYGAASADVPKNRAVMALLGGSSMPRGAAIQTGPAPEKRGKRGREPTPEVAEQEIKPAITVGAAPMLVQQPAQAAAAPAAHANTSDVVVFLGKSPFVVTPDVVMIKNHSGYCVKFWLNGRALKIYEGSMEVPCVPHKSKSFVKVPSFGEYQLQASGSSAPFPFKGIVAYQKVHTFVHDKKQTLTLTVADFYAVNQ